MVFHGGLHHKQAQAAAIGFAGFQWGQCRLRCQEPRAVVGHAEHNGVAFALQPHCNGGGAGCNGPGNLQRFKGIAQQIDHGYLDLGPIPQHRQAGFEALALHRDACSLEARACVKQGAAGHVGQVESPLVGLHVAQQGAHLFNRRYDLIGVAGDRLEMPVQIGGQGSFLLVQQQFAVKQQGAEGQVDFVGHGCGLQAAFELVFQH